MKAASRLSREMFSCLPPQPILYRPNPGATAHPRVTCSAAISSSVVSVVMNFPAFVSVKHWETASQ